MNRKPQCLSMLSLALMLVVLLGWSTQKPVPAIAVHTIRPDADSLVLAADLGVDAVVQLFSWRDIEPTQDQFYWQLSDETVAGVVYYGIDLIVRLDQPPDWALDLGIDAGEPPFDLVAYDRYVRAVVTRYRGKVKGYIIWNEPNLALEWAGLPPDPAAYIELLRVGARAVAKSDPDALVISAGLAPTNTINKTAVDDRRFLEAMYEHGAADLFDVLGVHAYGFGLPPQTPFVAPEDGDDNLAGLVFRRATALRQIMEANGDGHKPVYITEMGWTVRSVAHSAWQVVTPAQQAAYLLDAFEIAYAEWPWLALITVWNLDSETNPEWSGYNLLDAQGQIRPAYTALRKFLRSDAPGSERWMRWQQDKRSDPPQRYQVLAEDVTIHLGDAEMPLPWVALHKGINPSPRWEGVVYIVDPGDKPWQLTLRSMQSNYWSNRVWINDLPLEDPIPLADFTKSWVAHTWTVPAGMLRSGPNKIAVTVAHAVPLIQAHRFAYDEIQIKDIELWR